MTGNGFVIRQIRQAEFAVQIGRAQVYPEMARAFAINRSSSAYYDWALKAGTTTNMSPDEVHQMGLDELASLHAQMDPILRSAGYTTGTVGDQIGRAHV